MRALLIHPLHEKPRRPERGKRPRQEEDGRYICFPLGIGYVAAALQADGHTVIPWDIHAENLPWQEVEERLNALSFDVVGISGISSQYAYVKRLAALIKSIRNVPVVVGGALATYSYHLLLKRCQVDFCVLGEGEVTGVQLLRNLKAPQAVSGVAYLDCRDRLHVTSPRPPIPDLGELPMPAYELFDMDFYALHNKKMQFTRADPKASGEPWRQRARSLKTGYVIAGRGCPYRCRFCSRSFPGFRIRPLDHLMKEILFLRDRYGVQFIHLGDELVTLGKRRTLEFSAAMKAAGMLWDCQSRVDLVDEEILRAMKDSGCTTVGFGIESGCRRLLDAMKKGITVGQIEQAMRATMKVGLDIKVQLMFGFPGENMDSLRQTIELFQRLGHPGRGMSYYTVLPGTEIYDFCVRHGIIRREEHYLCQLAEGAGEGKVLLNFTRFDDDEIHPRMRWARLVMLANAAQDERRRATRWKKAKKAVRPFTNLPWKRRLYRRLHWTRLARLVRRQMVLYKIRRMEAFGR